jgi:hypothetical protein
MSARVVDMTPTWRGILPLLVEIAADRRNPGSDTAWQELRRMADIADEAVAADIAADKAARAAEGGAA